MLSHWQEDIRIDEQFITSYWLPYALPACEGFWVLLTNFIFIRHMLQQCLISNWFSVIKTRLLFTPAAILKRNSASNLSVSCMSLLFFDSSLLHKSASTFSRSSAAGLIVSISILNMPYFWLCYLSWFAPLERYPFIYPLL